MQTLVLSILLTASINAGRLPAPTSNELVIFDRPGVIIKWELVKSDLEPVLGYKLADFTIRDGQLHEYTLTGADHSQLIINDIKEGTPYLFQILAFAASGDGEPSSPFGVKIQDKNSTAT